MSDLCAIAHQYQNTARHDAAIKWFQASTGLGKQNSFALMWRDGEESSDPIDFVRVFRYYQNAPHQNAALRWLENNSQPKTLNYFNELWIEAQTRANNSSTEIVLKVPYYQQVDNLYEPMRTCNTSSCAMVAKFLGAAITGDDQYYQIVRKYGDTTDHMAQGKALLELGIHSDWCTNLDYQDLDTSLDAGLPVVVGILHRGTLASPTGGHMIVVIGRTVNKDYVCHDPFGSLLDEDGAYTGAVNNGNQVVYPRSILNRRWLPEGNKSGWGRLFAR
jgi:Peptidase_C39 like family